MSFVSGKLLKAVVATMLLFALIDSESRSQSLNESLADGWNAWRVAAADNAVGQCCFTWSQGVAMPRKCNLDTHQSYQSNDRSLLSSPNEIQIYVLLQSGKATKIRALSPRCPVLASTAINDLGVVSAGESVSWLDEYVSPRMELSPDAIAAIASHNGPESTRLLLDTGRADRDPENRTDAIFWMAMTAVDNSEDEIKRAIANDPDSDVRERAVFALTLLPNERSTNGLVDVLENRRIELNLREEALFWLAQSESDDAFEYLSNLLTGN